MQDITKRSQVGLYDVIVGPGGELISSGAQDGNNIVPQAQSNPITREITFTGNTNNTSTPVVNVWQQQGGATGGTVPTGTNTSGRISIPVSTTDAPFVQIGSSNSNTAIAPTQNKVWDYQIGDVKTNVDGKQFVMTDKGFVTLAKPETKIIKTEGETVYYDNGGNSNNTFLDKNNDGFDDVTGKNVIGKNVQDVKDDVIKSQGKDDSLVKGFSWDEQAKSIAEIQAEQNILKAEQNALFARQQAMQAGEEGQQMSDMQKYVLAQSAEKAGWTGGYKLDQARQLDYLKASVQASMFNQQEMQKYGYDSQLTAARLAYEQGKQQLALEYYNSAVTQSLNEAAVTGFYISPEQKDMLQQYTVAGQKLNSADPNSEEYKNAAKIQNTIDEWFKASGLSKQGVQTLASISLKNETMRVEQARLMSAIANVTENDPGAVPLRDVNGNYIWSADGTSLKTFNPNTANANDLYNYYTGNLVVDGVKVTSGPAFLNTQLENSGKSFINTWYTGLSEVDKAKSSAELQTLLNNYLNSGTATNPIYTYINQIEQQTGKQFDLKNLLTKADANGMIPITLNTGNKSFTVSFDTRSNKFNVSTGTNDNTNIGVTSAQTYQDYIKANPQTATLYRTVSGPGGISLGAAINNANPETNTITLTKDNAAQQGFNTLLYKTYNTNMTIKEEIYGKLVNGNMYIVKVKP